jgi:sugar phosphate isomerase/epimerase
LMRLGIFAKTFGGTDPKVVLSAAATAGFDVVQYNMACSGLPAMPDHAPIQVVDAIHSAARETGVQIVALSGTYNMIHPDLAERERGHARLATLAALASELPTRLITLCTGSRDPDDQWRWHPRNDAPDSWSDLLASIEIAVAVADRYDVDLGIEPELANVVNSAEKARRIIDQIGSPRLKVVLDPANLFEHEALDAQRRIVAAAVDRLADRIIMGHAKDRTSEGEFTTAGKGVLDYGHYLACLKAAGFDGPIVAHGLAANEAVGVSAFLRSQCAAAGIEIAQ